MHFTFPNLFIDYPVIPFVCYPPYQLLNLPMKLINAFFSVAF